MKKDRDISGRPLPAAIADPRFARVQTDPRFMRMPKNKTKVSIDKRFSHMFSDKNFSDPLGADKRGRANKKKEKHMLQRYYKVDEDEDNDDAGGAADDEIQVLSKSKVKKVGVGKSVVAKSKKSGSSKGLVSPNFPGPIAPSKLGLSESAEESDEEENDSGNDEEIGLKPKLKGMAASGKLTRSKIPQGDKIRFDIKIKNLAKPKSSVPVVEESEEDDADLKLKLEGKKSGKLAGKAVQGDKLGFGIKGNKSAEPKSPELVVEESDEEEEIDLNSDESEGELEREAGAKTKIRIVQENSDSEEDEDASSGSDEELSSSSSSSSSESEAEEDLDDPRNEEKVPTAPGAETRRFAMMNMDWEHIKAVDLLMLMRSFQPKAGRIERVTVYPSEFGIEQMKAEQVHGPNMIFEDNDDEEDEDKEVSMEKLRAYEKNKLKYYYAVVECDSKETANHLYTQCDGMEFERTSNTLDLRFIPDDMKFVRDPRDVAKEVQDGYKAPEFETRALQHSTVKLTWDDDEPTRVKALRKKFSADELNEMDFRAYLASESSEEELADDDDEDESPSSPERGDASNGEGSKSKKDKYRSLLFGDSGEEVVELPGQKAKKGDVDMEVTFHTGLSELSEKLMQRKEAKKRGDETVWEAYLRKKKEKKAQKKRSKNAKSDDDDDDYSGEDVAASPRKGQGDADPFFANNENGFDDPFFADDAAFPDQSKAAPKKISKTKSKDSERLRKREEKEQQKKEEERSKAELELLLMDDDGVQDAARGFNLKSKKDKKKKDKGKKKKKGGELDGDQEEEEDKLATADLTDPRFAPLFSNHHFAIDPTNPQFRKSAAQLKILAESQRRRVQKSADSTPANDLNPDNAIDAALGASQDRKRKAEISSLVRSLKRKAGKPGVG